MTVYLLHFSKPIGNPNNPRGQAQHYLGYTKDLERRLAEHRKGNGARLVEVFLENGVSFEVVRIWPGDRSIERKLKDLHNTPRLCPICNPSAFNHARYDLPLALPTCPF